MTTKRPGALVLLSAALAAGCSSRLDLGSSILWSAEHETGDFSEWAAGGVGSYSADAPDTAITISTDVAHGGTRSVKLTNGAVADYQTARLWRQDDYPVEGYYSAWFYLPRSYQTTANWTLMQFRVPGGDGAGPTLLIDLDLRSLPDGSLILSVFDHRDEYLRSPTPDPAHPVPIGKWFQIEALYRNAADESGELAIWMDGQLDYDLHRPLGLARAVNWSVCSSTAGLTPTSSTLYVDDAAVSVARVTPGGSIR